jgi:hypothetical protein
LRPRASPGRRRVPRRGGGGALPPAAFRAGGTSRCPPWLGPARSARARRQYWRGPSRRRARRAGGRRIPGGTRRGRSRTAGLVSAGSRRRHRSARRRSVADHRHLPPGRHLQDRGYRHHAGLAHPAHGVLVAVGQHDDVAAARPVLLPPATATQHVPLATRWNRMTRSVSGRKIFAVSRAVSDSYALGSRYSARKKTAPSNRSRRSADSSTADDWPWSGPVTRSGAPVPRSWPTAGPPTSTDGVTKHHRPSRPGKDT